MRLSAWDRLVRHNVSLSDKTFYGIAGKAEFFAVVDSIEDVADLLHTCQQRDCSWRVLGGGTNLLIQDGVLQGLTLCLNHKSFNTLEFEDSSCFVGAAVSTSHLALEAAKRNFGSALLIGGIPGTVGGAIAMNAGTPEGAMAQLISWVCGFDTQGHFRVWDQEACGFSYRQSQLQDGLILGAKLHFVHQDSQALEKLQKWISNKMDRQPYNARSAGCMFRNPPGHSAGQLIEAAGFKGRRLGDVEVSARHANFMLNHGQGTFAQAQDLMEQVRQAVFKKTSISLENEIVIWSNSKR